MTAMTGIWIASCSPCILNQTDVALIAIPSHEIRKILAKGDSHNLISMPKITFVSLFSGGIELANPILRMLDCMEESG